MTLMVVECGGVWLLFGYESMLTCCSLLSILWSGVHLLVKLSELLVFSKPFSYVLHFRIGLDLHHAHNGWDLGDDREGYIYVT